MKLALSSLPLATLATVSIALVSAPAHAAILGCASNIADDVSGTSACQYSTTYDQDSVTPNKPLTVNDQGGFFGISDWSFGGKIGENAGYAGAGSGQTGAWNLASVFKSSWSDVMLIFKSGNGTTLTGFQLTKGVTSGTWTSPFEMNNKAPKDVSHISVYYREGSTTPAAAVPEPTTILGTIAAGSLLLNRKKLQRTAR